MRDKGNNLEEVILYLSEEKKWNLNAREFTPSPMGTSTNPHFKDIKDSKNNKTDTTNKLVDNNKPHITDKHIPKTGRSPKGWNQFSQAYKQVESTSSTSSTSSKDADKAFKYKTTDVDEPVNIEKSDFPSLALTDAKVSTDDEASKFLISMFPELPALVVLDTYATHLKNMDKTVMVLIGISSEITEDDDVEKQQEQDTRGNHHQHHKNGGKISNPGKMIQPTKTLPNYHAQDPSSKNLLKSNNSDQQQEGSLIDNEVIDRDVLYKKERIVTIRLNREKNKLFRKAAQAFDSGNHSLALSLVTQGRIKGEEADKSGEIAAQNIFDAVNKNNCVDKIDLHGLQAWEAINFLDQRLKHLSKLRSVSKKQHQQHHSSSNIITKIEVITGWGRHQSALPVLRPAVVDYLTQNKLSYQEPSPGNFIVIVKRNFI
eukprot:TRINITY_DN3665_c0_g1_i1.p2 TRINITY_DN3665_c0_g1~~TRINITY_DN3665_c0_g1_i1.p2  ORF type:complete len:450 (-),score=116.86 TRINITY_DN3665_c0_g1_i1:1791-3077(-)